MLLNEKIERLKKEFPQTHFRDLFVDGSQVLKTIERNFVVTNDLNKDVNNLRQRHNYWPDNIKSKKEIRLSEMYRLDQWLTNLNASKNYWTVVSVDEYHSFKYYVYDCKPDAIKVLVSLLEQDFFIVDKKYTWFTYFKLDTQSNQCKIFKSGDTKTPFEA
jgi:hypothetical protein